MPTDPSIDQSQDPELAYYQQLQAENEAVASPLTTPPGTNEYDSLQSQIDANTTGLQAPPVVSEEEINSSQTFTSESRKCRQRSRSHFR